MKQLVYATPRRHATRFPDQDMCVYLFYYSIVSMVPGIWFDTDFSVPDWKI